MVVTRVHKLSTLFSLTPENDEEKEWLAESVAAEPVRWQGGNLLVDQRCVGEIIFGAGDQGFEIKEGEW